MKDDNDLNSSHWLAFFGVLLILIGVTLYFADDIDGQEVLEQIKAEEVKGDRC